MTTVEQKIIDADEAGMRLDRWFKLHFPGLGFGQLQKLLRSGQIRIDGGRVKSARPSHHDHEWYYVLADQNYCAFLHLRAEAAIAPSGR